MDFSWVKQLADQSNQVEIQRQEKERRDKEDKKNCAMVTGPFVEKLFVVISGATEEFNKHCIFPHLRMQIGKLYKHSRTEEHATAEPDEVAYFGFIRCSWLYGIRGVNGHVEFIQMPVGDASALNLKLHEVGAETKWRMSAEAEPQTRKVRWIMDGAPMDGAAIVSLCQRFFIDLIERTNVAEESDKQYQHSYH